jgi:hypothetical protein
VQIGSIVWQPVFFSGIAVVLGMEAMLAGAVLAHTSSVTPTGVGQRFAFVGKPNFPSRCVRVGVAMALLGLALNLLLFLLWLGDRTRTTLSHFGLASLSQSLIIVGGTVATFGILSRFQRARAAREPAAETSSKATRVVRP